MIHHLVAAFIVQGERILLGKRSPQREFYPNVWDVFGGHIEPGEQPDQTLIRELEEELGITPVQWTKLEMIRESVPEHGRTPPHEIVVHAYCVTAWSRTPFNRQPEEHSTIEWFSYDEAVTLDLAYHDYPRFFAQCLQSPPATSNG